MDFATQTSLTGPAWLLLPFLAFAVATDLWRREIPNLLILTMIGSALVLNGAVGQLDGLFASLGGATIGLLLLLPMYVLGGMGGGDVKLLAAAGGFLGPWGALLGGILTLTAGGVLALVVLSVRALRRPLRVRAAGHYAALPSSEIQLPYSVAVATGTGLAALQIAGAGPLTLVGLPPW